MLLLSFSLLRFKLKPFLVQSSLYTRYIRLKPMHNAKFDVLR
jgi:hypothetical protein